MARITVEDCTTKIKNRFELCIVTGCRARGISSGSVPCISNDKNEKPAVVALREIASGLLDIELVKANVKKEIKEGNLFSDDNLLQANKFNENTESDNKNKNSLLFAENEYDKE